MLSIQINNDSLFAEQSAQGESDVVRPAIKLTPVAYIQEVGEGIYSRSCAEMYFTPDQQKIIRFPSSFDNRFYDYANATQVPATHPVWAALRDPNRDVSREIEILQDKEGDIGKPADPALIKWFEATLAPQLQKEYAELRKAQGLEP